MSEHLETIHKFGQCIGEKNWTEVRKLVTPDFVDHNPEWGVSSIDDIIRTSVDIVDKLATSVVLKAMFSEGDKAVLHLGFTGVHRKEAFGFAATGKRVEWDAVEIYRFSTDGRIAEIWHYSRILPLLEQLGLQGMETHRSL